MNKRNIHKWLNEETACIPKPDISELLVCHESMIDLLKRSADYMQDTMDGDYNNSISMEIYRLIDSLKE